MSEPTNKLHNLSLPTLLEYLQANDRAVKAHKDDNAAILAEVARRTAADFKAAFEAGEKTHGELTLEREGVKIVGAIEREVKWDSKKLMDVAATLDWDKVKKIFKIEFAVPEAIYKAMTEEELLQRITAARSTKLKPLKVSLKAE